MKKINVLILGTGKIGCDLLVKVMRSPLLDCKKFIGRSLQSEGIRFAQQQGVPYSTKGFDALEDHYANVDVIFDATSASAHQELQKLLHQFSGQIINLTPENVGMKCVPAINLQDASHQKTINLITCGGQVALPIIAAVKSVTHEIKYIEVVSSIAAKSAGPATRYNINEYLETTESAITAFSGTSDCKVILNINPAEPEVFMQTTISFLINNYESVAVMKAIKMMVEKVKKYAPHYELICEPHFKDSQLIVMIRVGGNGDFLPTYAGNLDIITSAAVKVAENYRT